MNTLFLNNVVLVEGWTCAGVLAEVTHLVEEP
jgi:hypothetical protein